MVHFGHNGDTIIEVANFPQTSKWCTCIPIFNKPLIGTCGFRGVSSRVGSVILGVHCLGCVTRLRLENDLLINLRRNIKWEHVFVPWVPYGLWETSPFVWMVLPIILPEQESFDFKICASTFVSLVQYISIVTSHLRLPTQSECFSPIYHEV